MAILGAALRKELAEALGLSALRKDLRAELRGLRRELGAVRTALNETLRPNGRGTAGESASKTAHISAEQIRKARKALGDSRKAFAARLAVSPGIVFAWESGRSVPRRKAIVARLQRLLRAQPSRGTTNRGAKPTSGKAGPARKRVLNLSTKRRATLRLQGQYMGHLRSLGAAQRAQVKKAKATSGFLEAIKLAKKLRKP